MTRSLTRIWIVVLVLHAGGIASLAGVFPGAQWEARTPEEVGLARLKLEALHNLVGGRGCVVRHGYLVYSWGDQSRSSDVASAFKPVLSTLLLMAVEEGRLKTVDDRVADAEPRLKTLNQGKDGGITWRQLASQTSGYGLAEAPGAAYSYNDFALTLYYDILTQKVFQTNGTEVLRTRLAEPLQFEDAFTFNAFRRPDRDGRLALSVRDFARIGLLYLHAGRWRDQQLLKPELIQMAINSPISAETPLTSDREAGMLPGQHSIGGTRNITPVGPGYYSFNWWLNRTNRAGQRLFVDAPPDTYVASGHGGKRTLWIFPGLDMIVCWNDSPIDDHDKSPGNPDAKCNQAVKLIVEAALKTDAGSGRTKLSITNSNWQLNDAITYRGTRAEGLLLNVRMVNSTFEDLKRPEFDAEANTDEFIARIPEYTANGVRAFTLNLQGGFPGYEGAVNSAFNSDGSLRAAGLSRIRRVVEACERNGAAVILGCFYQRQDQGLADANAVRAGVSNIVGWIVNRGFRNVALEIANEFDHTGFDHLLLKTVEGQIELIQLAKRLAPGLLVSTSGQGHGTIPEGIARASDFLLLHFNGTTLDKIPARIAALKKFGKPIVCNEDNKTGAQGAAAAKLCAASGASWGFMSEAVNQRFPFKFDGAADDPLVYQALKELARSTGP